MSEDAKDDDLPDLPGGAGGGGIHAVRSGLRAGVERAIEPRAADAAGWLDAIADLCTIKYMLLHHASESGVVDPSVVRLWVLIVKHGWHEAQRIQRLAPPKPPPSIDLVDTVMRLKLVDDEAALRNAAAAGIELRDKRIEEMGAELATAKASLARAKGLLWDLSGAIQQRLLRGQANETARCDCRSPGLPHADGCAQGAATKATHEADRVVFAAQAKVADYLRGSG